MSSVQLLLQTQGSRLSAVNGGPLPINPLATPQSLLHYDPTQPGYSISGNDSAIVNLYYQQYNVGINRSLPQPSLLDLSGVIPSYYYPNNAPPGAVF
jgi:hypothetical protein